MVYDYSFNRDGELDPQDPSSAEPLWMVVIVTGQNGIHVLNHVEVKNKSLSVELWIFSYSAALIFVFGC